MATRQFLAGLFLLLLPLCTIANVLDVPDNYATITLAIANAGPHDTVLVHPGTYPERIMFPATNFCLFSEYALTGDSNVIASTIVDASSFAGEDTASVLIFVNGNDSSMTVSGFTIRGGHGTVGWDGRRYGGGLNVVGSHPTLRSNIITANEADLYAAAVFQESYSVFSRNSVFANCAHVAGLFGIFYNYALERDFVFEWNNIFANYGCVNGDSSALIDAGILTQECRLTLRFNYFHDYAGFQVLGVEYYNSSGEMRGNIFERLTADVFGIVAVAHRHDVVIRDNIFRDCRPTDGGCISVQRDGMFGTSVVERNWFENIVNEATGPACIYAQHPNIHISENVFVNCLGGSAAGIQISQMQGEGCLGDIVHNQFFGNRVWNSGYPNLAAAIMVTGNGLLCSVRDNWFEGNIGDAVAAEFSDQPPWDLSQNYWGDASGPYHPALNPQGQGDTLHGNFVVFPWLETPPTEEISSPRSLTVPANWTMEAPYPNPFNSVTRFRLVSDHFQLFEVTLYTIQGRKVGTIWRGLVPRDGVTEVVWDGTDEHNQPCASGLYLIAAHPLTGVNRIPQTTKALLLR